MANTLKFGNGQWAVKDGSTLAYNDENGNFKPLPFDFTRATSATRVNKQGLIETVGSNKPRIDFLNDSNGALLLEPQRTNFQTFSEQIDNAAWGLSSVTVSANNATSPDGTLNADKVVETATTARHEWYGLSLSFSGNNAVSVYAKYAGRKFFCALGGAGGGGATFDLLNGTVAGNTAVSASIQSVGNGWYRCTVIINFTGTNQMYFILRNDSGVGVDTYTGDGTSGVLFWGIQTELNASYATSYIPTQGSAVTKTVDVCSQTPPSGIIGQTEGVMFVDFNFTGGYDTSGIIPIVIRSGTNSAYIFINVSGTLNCDFFDGNVLQARLTTNIGISGRKKIAFAYKQNDFVAYMNGVQIGTDTNGTVGAMGILNVGSYYTGGYSTIGGVNQSQLYNTRLSNTELATLTTI
jgi:hypothetical protein